MKSRTSVRRYSLGGNFNIVRVSYGFQAAQCSSHLQYDGDNAKKAQEDRLVSTRSVDIEVLWVLVTGSTGLSNRCRLRAEARIRFVERSPS